MQEPCPALSGDGYWVNHRANMPLLQAFRIEGVMGASPNEKPTDVHLLVSVGFGGHLLNSRNFGSGSV
jgi:hypothetical protein